MIQNSRSNRNARARDLGIPFDGVPGKWNAITDVGGIEVGFTTIIRGDGKRAVRTGVTAIHPRGKRSADPVFAGWFPLNGNGEMTGTTWMEESGFLEGPVLLTNTHSVGVVRDAVVAWQVKHKRLFQDYSYPVVAETYDGYLNDINGFHVTAEHVMAALDTAKGGRIAEGNVGGGTGTQSFEFKGGTGTSSRKCPVAGMGTYMVGVLVQSNFGRRWQLQIAGSPVGRHLKEHAPFTGGEERYDDSGSIIVVVATDAPLLPHQLKRLAKRAALGVARTGGMAMNGSGDLMLAFSTANPGAARTKTGRANIQALTNDRLDSLFAGAILATEEAIINALIAAETMGGYDGHTLHALPHQKVTEVLKNYGRGKDLTVE